MVTEGMQQYDRNLTAEHTYLGTNFVDVSGRVIIDVRGTHDLIIVGKRKIILVPGEQFPLMLNYPREQTSLVKEMLERKVFGFLYPGQKRFGTTASLRSVKEENSSDSDLLTLSIKAESSQRFEVVRKDTMYDEFLYRAEIRIRPELSIPPPHVRLFLKPDAFKNKISLLTPFPQCAYNVCDQIRLMKTISQEIKKLYKKDAPTMDPVRFSYWVTANVPIDNTDRLRLLSTATSNERLWLALKFLQRDAYILCRSCDTQVSSKRAMFSMSTNGLQGTFVNAHGYQHEMITLTTVMDVMYYGSSTANFSWFPGYAWSVAQCRYCGHHVGWKFTTTKDLLPRIFWGVTRESIKFSEKPESELPNEFRDMIRHPRFPPNLFFIDSDESDQ